MADKHLHTGSLSPDVKRWAASVADDERKAVLIRVARRLDPEEACERLTAMGAEITTSGRGAIGAMVTSLTARSLAEHRWVVRVEFPQQLFPRSLSKPE